MNGNPYEKMSDKELADIAKDVIYSKEQGCRAESLVPYAKEIFKNLNLDTNKPTIMLNECLNMAHYDLTMAIMKRFVNKIDDDMKHGYNICGQCLNEEIDTMIDEVHDAYMNNADESAKERLDAQIKILWTVKDKIENAICDYVCDECGAEL